MNQQIIRDMFPRRASVIAVDQEWLREDPHHPRIEVRQQKVHVLETRLVPDRRLHRRGPVGTREVTLLAIPAKLAPRHRRVEMTKTNITQVADIDAISGPADPD